MCATSMANTRMYSTSQTLQDTRCKYVIHTSYFLSQLRYFLFTYTWYTFKVSYGISTYTLKVILNDSLPLGKSVIILAKYLSCFLMSTSKVLWKFRLIFFFGKYRSNFLKFYPCQWFWSENRMGWRRIEISEILVFEPP